mgnify:CR=1 FL=1
MLAQPPFAAKAATAAIWSARRELGRTTVAVVRNPFELFIDRALFSAAPDGATLADLAPAEPGAWVCCVDGEYIGRDNWHYMPPQGAIVVFRALPQGGGKGGSNPLRIVLMLAAFAVIGPGAFGLQGLGLTGWTAFAATTAASLLINALIPLDGSNATGGGGQIYSAQAQGNQLKIGQPIPELFGYDHGYPDLAAQPYSLYVNNEQYLFMMLVVGRGQYRIDRVSLGDTSVASYSDVELVRIGAGQDTQTGPGVGVVLPADQDLVDMRVHTSPDVNGIEMKTNAPVGPFACCPPERTVTGIGIDIILPRGLDTGLGISWRVSAQRVNDFDQPLAAEFWLSGTGFGMESYSTASVLPMRLCYNYPVPEGRYMVRLVRTDPRSASDGSAHDISWLAMRATLSQSMGVNAGDCTLVGIKIRASGQLSGSMRARVMSRRMLRTWTGSAWTAPVETRNPAWALTRVFEARGVPDSQIDLAQILALSQVWADRQDNFDYRFDTVSTTWDALALIARVGRAVPLIRGSKYTVARDGPETTPVAAYGMRNIRKGSSALALSLPTADPMNTLDLEYFDHRKWDWVTVTAQIYGGLVYGYRGDLNRPAGVPAPDDLERGRIKMPGIIGENHAIRTAVYTLADSYYRRMVATYSTELDGLLPPPLALTVLQHDVGNFGQCGDVALWVAGTLTLSTTEPLVWETGATHYVRLAAPTGVLDPAVAVTPGATDHDMVLASAPSFTPLFEDAGRERTRYYFGPATNMGALARVRAIVPRSDREVEHRVVLEDNRVHAADNAWLPAGAVQDPLSTGAGNEVGDGRYYTNLTALGAFGRYGYGNATNQAYAAIEFRADGGYSQNGTLPDTFVLTIADIAALWLTPHPATQAITGLYEVRATLIPNGPAWVGGPTQQGTLDPSSPALDVWHSLASTRTWSMTNSAAGVLSVKLLLEIRVVATGVVNSSGTFYLRTTVS